MSKVFVFKNYGGPEHQALIELPTADPGADEIAIQVKAAGVNPVDWKIREGLLGRHEAPPVPMGREASGIVTAVGEGVEDFVVGDEVLGLVAHGAGAFAEYTLLRADRTVAKPEEISFEDAAAIPVSGTAAYDATHQIELESGQTLLIVGAGGGVGRMAVQIGKVHNFKVLGVASAAKRELVESAGATFIESGDGLAERARQAAPDGVDLIVDLAGGDALRAVAPVAKDPSLILTLADGDTAREVGGSVVKRTDDSLGKITDVIKYGLVDPTVTSRYALAKAAQAIAEVEDGHAAGKVIVLP
ncbi:MAG: NADP-dependent oxidoreductase [Propionibacteriaceae bacterium]|nr:NADP-dependent oxidoreductase [Propionibacteriaceae bacterium]